MELFKKNNYPFIAVLLMAIFLRFWNLLKFDLQSDPAINAFRSLGWLDLLGGGQTSPILWFRYIPSWARLSFHDGPPLTFAIQHLSFLIFGNNVLAALLPYILANLGIIIIIYLLLKQVGQEKAGLIATSIFAISSYTTWMARTGYLEGLETFFITLSIYVFLNFLQKGKNKYLYLWASLVGLALLCKYTAIFLLPAVFFYILFWQRRVFKNKHFWLSFLLTLLILTPIIIYNIMVFKTRGHFDAALSSMIGMRPADFSILTRSANLNVFGNWLSILKSLYRSISLPLLILYLGIFAYALYSTIRRRNSHLNNFLLSNVIFILLMFSFSGGEVRFLLILTPLLILLTAIYLQQWRQKLNSQSSAKIFAGLMILILAFELFFSLNTNILAQPLIKNRFFYSPDRFYGNGFNQLEKYLRQEVLTDLPARKKITTYEDITKSTGIWSSMVLVDERINWFSRLWYINRYQIYYKQPIFYYSHVLKINEEKIKNKTFINALTTIGENGGIKDFWLIFATDQGVSPGSDEKKYGEYMVGLQKELEEAGYQPVQLIENYAGQAVFKIYHFYTTTKSN